MRDPREPDRHQTERRPWLAAGALGFALGGFFDGILLHQILQWHHLLSGLPDKSGDLRFLVMTDGLFHLAMYAVAFVGLWGLWHARKSLGTTARCRPVIAWALIGFGSWHGIDAILSHWLLGIHRIRMDSDMPLVWDVLWLLVFGLLPLALGLKMRRDGGEGGDIGAGTRATTRSAWLLSVLTIGAGLAQALPPPTDQPVMVMFRRDLSPEDAMAAIEAVNGQVVGQDATGTLWALQVPSIHSPASLYLHGALLVSGTGVFAGCLDYTRPQEA
jgi:uncharacterized membrane protein